MSDGYDDWYYRFNYDGEGQVLRVSWSDLYQALTSEYEGRRLYDKIDALAAGEVIEAAGHLFGRKHTPAVAQAARKD
jgi:hypothetical protein